MKQYSDEIISKINAEVETCCVDGDLSSDKALYMINFIRAPGNFWQPAR